MAASANVQSAQAALTESQNTLRLEAGNLRAVSVTVLAAKDPEALVPMTAGALDLCLLPVDLGVFQDREGVDLSPVPDLLMDRGLMVPGAEVATAREAGAHTIPEADPGPVVGVHPGAPLAEAGGPIEAGVDLEVGLQARGLVMVA